MLLLAAPVCLSAAENTTQEKKKEDGLYVWTDEQGVVHMRDKKPEHLDENMTRMEQRERFLKRHPEARKQADDLASGKSQLPDDAPGGSTQDDALYQPPPDQSTQTQQQMPFSQGQDFQPQMQLSPMQLLLATGLPLLIGLLLYVATSYVLYRIGRKFGIGSFVGYLIPIYNVVLLCRCAGLTGWFVLFLFVPIINIFVTFLIWGKIAERLGKNLVLWGLLCALLGLPIIILAFDGSMPVDASVIPPSPPEDQPNVYI